MKKLAIAIPTYNEKDNLKELIYEVKKVMEPIKIDTTIFIIDDNSPDGTGKIADKLSSKMKKKPFKVVVIHRKGKLGLASAYIKAFNVALENNCDYIMSMDADFSHQPKYLPHFLKHIQKYDFVIGSRNIKGGGVENWSIIRKLVSKGGSLYSRIILGVNIKDFTAGFVMYKQKVLRNIDLENLKSEGYSFAIEMKYRCVKKGFKYFEFPIIFPDRKKGKAKMSRKIFFEAMLRVWQLRFSNI